MRLYKPLLLVFLFGLHSAYADDAPEKLHFNGRYLFAWNGITLGRLVLGIEERKDRYALHLLVSSEGIVNLFTRHVSDTEASGIIKDGKYMPRHYESHYQTKHKPRHIKLTFNQEGAVIEEINEPPEDRSDRPEVPHKLKDGAYDPLSGMMAIRAGLLVLPAFDAKRLYEVKAVPDDKTVLRLAGKKYAATGYIFSRTPLAGMTAKEMKEYSKGEPPLSFYFSDDARHIPLLIRLPMMLGSVEGKLVKECATWEECRQ